MTTARLSSRFVSLARLNQSHSRAHLPKLLTCNSIFSLSCTSFPSLHFLHRRAFTTNAASKQEPKEDIQYIVDVNSANFNTQVIKSPLPTILFFYSDSNPATKSISTVLEQFATQKKGYRLAKVNVDTNPEIAQDIGIRSIPALISVNKGERILDFSGGSMEQLKEFIDNTISLGQSFVEKIKTLSEKGNSLLEASDVPGATAAFNQLIEDKTLKSEAIGFAGLVRCALKDENLELAKELVTILRDKHKDSLDKNEVRQAISQVELASESGSSKGANVEELKKKVSADPDDQQSRFDLAEAYLAKGHYEAAVDECLLMIKKEKRWNDEAARKLLLKIFEVAGLSSPLTTSARQRLSRVWFL